MIQQSRIQMLSVETEQDSIEAVLVNGVWEGFV
jgi:hypothetical protein